MLPPPHPSERYGLTQKIVEPTKVHLPCTESCFDQQFHVIGNFLIRNTRKQLKVNDQGQMSPKFNHVWSSAQHNTYWHQITSFSGQ